jgi:hypothetical protein
MVHLSVPNKYLTIAPDNVVFPIRSRWTPETWDIRVHNPKNEFISLLIRQCRLLMKDNI